MVWTRQTRSHVVAAALELWASDAVDLNEILEIRFDGLYIRPNNLGSASGQHLWRKINGVVVSIKQAYGGWYALRMDGSLLGQSGYPIRFKSPDGAKTAVDLFIAGDNSWRWMEPDALDSEGLTWNGMKTDTPRHPSI